MDDAAAPRDLAPGTLPRPRSVLAADALHRFWRRRMSEAPSLDHAQEREDEIPSWVLEVTP